MQIHKNFAITTQGLANWPRPYAQLRTFQIIVRLSSQASVSWARLFMLFIVIRAAVMLTAIMDNSRGHCQTVKESVDHESEVEHVVQDQLLRERAPREMYIRARTDSYLRDM